MLFAVDVLMMHRSIETGDYGGNDCNVNINISDIQCSDVRSFKEVVVAESFSKSICNS